jgi:hypothetical protein
VRLSNHAPPMGWKLMPSLAIAAADDNFHASSWVAGECLSYIVRVPTGIESGVAGNGQLDAVLLVVCTQRAD